MSIRSFLSNLFKDEEEKQRQIAEGQANQKQNVFKEESFGQKINRAVSSAATGLNKVNTALESTAPGTILNPKFIAERSIKQAEEGARLHAANQEKIKSGGKPSLLETAQPLLYDLAGAVPGPDDVAFGAFDYLKAKAAGKDPKEAFRGNEYTGLGEAVAGAVPKLKGTNIEKGLDIAELPAVLIGGGIVAKKTAAKQAANLLDDATNIIKYKPAKNLDEAGSLVEAKFGKYLNESFDDAVTEYKGRFGKVLNTDNARELSADYNLDRNRMSVAVHEPASAFVKKMYADALATPSEFNDIQFTAGGTGAGKTTGINDAKRFLPENVEPQLIYDTNLSSYGSSKQKIDQALAAGKNAEINYVIRDPIASLTDGAIPRANRMGRTVPLEAHVNTHADSLETIKKLYKDYEGNPKVKINFIDNNGPKGTAKMVSFDDIKNIEYNKIELKKALQNALDEQHSTGIINDQVYEGFSGQKPLVSREIGTQGQSILEESQLQRDSRGIDRTQLTGKQLSTPSQELVKPTQVIDDLKNKDVDLDLINKIYRDENIPAVATTKELEQSKIDLANYKKNNIPAGEKERKAITTARGADLVTPEVAQDIEGSYRPISNKESLDVARKRIESSFDDALEYAKTGGEPSAEKTATQLEILRISQEKGDYSTAIDVVEAAAEQLTKAGQEIQAYAMIGRLTPEGALRKAQRDINLANTKLPQNKQLKLNEEEAKQITEFAKQIQGLADGREKQKLIGQMLKVTADKIPSSVGNKLSTLQTMSHLLNPKTWVRNVVGNQLFSGLETGKDVVAAGVDRVVSLITGERTKALPSVGTQLKGWGKGFSEGLEDAMLGIDTTGRSGKFDIKSTATFHDPILGSLEKVMNVELRAFDRASFTAAFDDSLRQSMKAKGIDNLADATPEILQWATQDGLYRTFQDDTKLATSLSTIKKGLNAGQDFGLGDFIAKYSKTPANIFMRGFDYTPGGFVNSVYELVKATRGNFDQKNFVESLSRASTGTGLIMLGAKLFGDGIVTGKEADDYEIGYAQERTGSGPFRVNMSALGRYFTSGFKKQTDQEGDKITSYDWAQPVAIPFTIGVDMANGSKAANAIGKAIEGMAAAEETLTNQPVIQNLLDFAGTAGREGITEALKDTTANTATSIIPTFVKQFAQIADQENLVRNTYDPDLLKETGKKIQSRIPLVRNQLPASRDTAGEAKKSFKNGANIWNVFFNPSFGSEITSDPVAEETMKIFENAGETQQAQILIKRKESVNGVNTPLKQDERLQLQEYVGKNTQKMFEKMIANEEFQKLSDQEKAKIMSNAISDVKTAGRIKILGHRPKNVSGAIKDILRATQDFDFESLPLVKE